MIAPLSLSLLEAAKSRHFVILLCLMPDDFTCDQRSDSGWERVNKKRQFADNNCLMYCDDPCSLLMVWGSPPLFATFNLQAFNIG